METLVPRGVDPNDVHAHPRDARVRFQEEGHVYYIDGRANDIVSATSLIKSYTQPFDPDAVIAKMRKSKKWGPQNPYYDMSDDAIKTKWKTEGERSSALGTELHAAIEMYYRGTPQPLPSVEYGYFLQYARDHAEMRPYRTEWVVYSDDHRICGSIDMVFEKEDGSLCIRDWKRSKEIKKNNPYQRMQFPLDHLPDCNYYHYALQLNLYAWILRRYYEKTVHDLELVVFHDTRSTYECVPVPDLREEIEVLMRLRYLDLHGEDEPRASLAST